VLYNFVNLFLNISIYEKIFRFKNILSNSFVWGLSLWAQQTPATTAVAPISNYNYHVLLLLFLQMEHLPRSAEVWLGHEY
jgi:hypothetical protein